MHVQIQREGGVGGPDPIPGKSQVLSNSIEISIWTPPLVNSVTPPRIPGIFFFFFFFLGGGGVGGLK